ncbi:Protein STRICTOSIDINE SYNTHASE-LIKE 5 [Bienertia sinuspersici]
MANSSSLFFLSWFIPIAIALFVFLFRNDPFNPAPFPTLESSLGHKDPPKVNSGMLQKAEFVGSGRVIGPEDMAYEPRTRVIYTGCADGWVKRVKVGGDSVVEDWVNTGGRPLGIAVTSSGNDVILADAYKKTTEQEVVK